MIFRSLTAIDVFCPTLFKHLLDENKIYPFFGRRHHEWKLWRQYVTANGVVFADRDDTMMRTFETLVALTARLDDVRMAIRDCLVLDTDMVSRLVGSV